MSDSDSKASSRTLSLTTGGITLIGVLVSVGATVGFGLSGEWWVRVMAGVGTTVVLTLAVKLGTSSGRGPLAGLAHWIIGIDAAEDGNEDEDEKENDGGEADSGGDSANGRG